MREALGPNQMDQNVEEHDKMREALGKLSSLTPEDPDYDMTVEQLISDVMEHVRLEEEDELPQVQQSLSEEELQALGEEMERFKQSPA